MLIGPDGVEVNLAAGRVFEKDSRVGLDAARISRAEVLGPELLQVVSVALEHLARSDDVVEQYQRARRTLAVRAFSLAARPASGPRLSSEQGVNTSAATDPNLDSASREPLQDPECILGIHHMPSPWPGERQRFRHSP